MLLAGALGIAESVGVVFVESVRGRTPAVDVLTAMRRSGQRPVGAMPRLWNIPARNLAFKRWDAFRPGPGTRRCGQRYWPSCGSAADGC